MRLIILDDELDCASFFRLSGFQLGLDVCSAARINNEGLRAKTRGWEGWEESRVFYGTGY